MAEGEKLDIRKISKYPENLTLVPSSVPKEVQTTEIGQRTRLSGLDRPQQDRQPLSWRAPNKGIQILQI